MLKKLSIGLGLFIVALFVGWIAASPAEKLKAGDTIPSVTVKNIHGVEVTIPNAKTKWIHLQFRRFAGCPICNLHMQSILQRYSELEAAGIQEIVFFHSPDSSLLPFQGKFPFDVIGDPEKKIYAQFGVDTSIYALLDVRVWPAIIKGSSLKDRPQGDPEGGALGRPADFLITPEGKIVASHYGRHAYDQWSVDEVLALAK